jgi:hypothetical protein
MKITKAMVLLTSGADKIMLETDYPCPFVKEFLPSQQPLSFTFDATYDTGAEYVKDNFGITPEVINTRPNQHKWRMYAPKGSVGYGGYKECEICGVNTYGSFQKYDPSNPVCPGKKCK